MRLQTTCSRIAAIVLLGILYVAAPAVAQTTIDNTTLSVAITSTSQNRISLAGITCTSCTFGDGFLLLVDDEVMLVTTAWTSGATNIPVIRGYAGIAGLHASGAKVMYGPGPGTRGQMSRFQTRDPQIGACTRASQLFMPWVNVGDAQRGNTPIRVWGCDNTNWYFGLNPTQITTRPLA